mmetsp:Transcript_55989/g.119058  ORF Transcript_55989/g.119058 Transcript_55989/m.119058 type:complete len:204 (-) Transcript_55989:699-1310(-)
MGPIAGCGATCLVLRVHVGAGSFIVSGINNIAGTLCTSNIKVYFIPFRQFDILAHLHIKIETRVAKSAPSEIATPCKRSSSRSESHPPRPLLHSVGRRGDNFPPTRSACSRRRTRRESRACSCTKKGTRNLTMPAQLGISTPSTRSSYRSGSLLLLLRLPLLQTADKCEDSCPPLRNIRSHCRTYRHNRGYFRKRHEHFFVKR